MNIDVSRDDAIGVIQCASKKRSDAGHLVADDGCKVLFVGDPAVAPTSRSLRYARPDDSVFAGDTYRERLEAYNRNSRAANPWGCYQPGSCTCARRIALWLTLWARTMCSSSLPVGGWSRRITSCQTTTSPFPRAPMPTSGAGPVTGAIGTSRCCRRTRPSTSSSSAARTTFRSSAT